MALGVGICCRRSWSWLAEIVLQFLEVLAQAFLVVGAAVAMTPEEPAARPSGVDVVEQGFKASPGELIAVTEEHPDLWPVVWLPIWIW